MASWIADGFRTPRLWRRFSHHSRHRAPGDGRSSGLRRSAEGDGEIVDADFSGGDDIGLVFVGQRFGRRAAAELVDPFVIGQRAANGHFSEDFSSPELRGLSAAHDHRRAAGYRRARRPPAGFYSRFRLSLYRLALAEVGVQQEFVADVEENFAFFEGRYANFGPWRSPFRGWPRDGPVLPQSHALYRQRS